MVFKSASVFSVRTDVSTIDPSIAAAAKKPSALRIKAMQIVVRIHLRIYVCLPLKLKSGVGRLHFLTSATGMRIA
jgi:hypothetical protein